MKHIGGHRQVLRFSISPLTQLSSAGLSALAVVVASRQGQLSNIAAFSAGSAVAAIVAVVTGGGTSLLFITGDSQERRAVRWVRWRLTAPTMMVACLAADLILGHIAELDLIALLLGSFTVVLQSLAALEVASLQRSQAMARWGASVLTSRVLPVVLLLAGTAYAAAMAAGSALLLGLLVIASRSSPAEEERVGHSGSAREAIRMAYRPNLSALAILDAALMRTPFLAAPLASSSIEAGAFAAILTAQQSLTAIFTSSLYTIMTVRSGQMGKTTGSFYARLEKFIVAASLPTAIATMALGPLFLQLFKFSEFPDFETIWIWTSASLPIVTLSRCLQYRTMANKEHGRAVCQIASATAVAVVLGAISWWQQDIIITSAAVATADAVGICTWLFIGRKGIWFGRPTSSGRFVSDDTGSDRRAP